MSVKCAYVSQFKYQSCFLPCKACFLFPMLWNRIGHKELPEGVNNKFIK